MAGVGHHGEHVAAAGFLVYIVFIVSFVAFPLASSSVRLTVLWTWITLTLVEDVLVFCTPRGDVYVQLVVLFQHLLVVLSEVVAIEGYHDGLIRDWTVWIVTGSS